MDAIRNYVLYKRPLFLDAVARLIIAMIFGISGDALFDDGNKFWGCVMTAIALYAVITALWEAPQTDASARMFRRD